MNFIIFYDEITPEKVSRIINYNDMVFNKGFIPDSKLIFNKMQRIKTENLLILYQMMVQKYMDF